MEHTKITMSIEKTPEDYMHIFISEDYSKFELYNDDSYLIINDTSISTAILKSTLSFIKKILIVCTDTTH